MQIPATGTSRLRTTKPAGRRREGHGDERPTVDDRSDRARRVMNRAAWGDDPAADRGGEQRERSPRDPAHIVRDRRASDAAAPGVPLRGAGGRAASCRAAAPSGPGRRRTAGPSGQKKKARRRGPSLLRRTVARLLGLDELARLVHDDLAAGDLRRVRERRLQLLLAHPVGYEAGRLVGVRRGVEEAD